MDSIRDLASLLLGILVGLIGNFFVSAYYYYIQYNYGEAAVPAAWATTVFAGFILLVIVVVIYGILRRLKKNSDNEQKRILCDRSPKDQIDKVIEFFCILGLVAIIVEQTYEVFLLQETPISGISVIFLGVTIIVYVFVVSVVSKSHI